MQAITSQTAGKVGPIVSRLKDEGMNNFAFNARELMDGHFLLVENMI
jgi:hypothetical protein